MGASRRIDDGISMISSTRPASSTLRGDCFRSSRRRTGSRLPRRSDPWCCRSHGCPALRPPRRRQLPFGAGGTRLPRTADSTIPERLFAPRGRRNGASGWRRSGGRLAAESRCDGRRRAGYGKRAEQCANRALLSGYGVRAGLPLSWASRGTARSSEVSRWECRSDRAPARLSAVRAPGGRRSPGCRRGRRR